MPIYRFRLEAQDGSGHFRRGRINEPSREDAEATLMLREYEYVKFKVAGERANELMADYDLDGDGVADLLENGWRALRDESGVQLAPRDRAHVELHRQTKPYALVELEEVEGTEEAA